MPQNRLPINGLCQPKDNHPEGVGCRPNEMEFIRAISLQT